MPKRLTPSLLETLESRLILSAAPVPTFGVEAVTDVLLSRFHRTAPAAVSAEFSVQPVGLAPIAPANNVRATSVSTNAISLAWNDNSTDEIAYTVYRSLDGSDFTNVASLGADATAYTDANLSAGTQYRYFITASTEDTDANSNVLSVQTLATNAPTTPTGLVLASSTTSSLTLNWNDTANESGYYLYRSTDRVNYSLVAKLTANTTSYTNTGLTAGTNYYYCLSSFNSTGRSGYANLTGKTLSLTAPSAPTGLAYSNVTSSSVSLSWTDTSASESGFRVYRSTDSVNFSLLATVGANTTTYTNSGLSDATTYYYRVAAYNAAGEVSSVISSVQTLLAAILPSVTIQTVNMTSFDEIDITGSSQADNILVTQALGTLTILANGQLSTYSAGNYGNIVIKGGAGSDVISIDASVNIASLIYGGDGADVLSNKTSAHATIVDIDSSLNTVTGNGLSTSYWVNPNDLVTASSAEIAAGAVNRVSAWYQTSVGAVPRALAGQNLADPSDSGATHRVTNNSFWGTGPSITDINQGSIGDCYFLAPIASLAHTETLKFMNTGVDLGDGTYAVRFIKNGVTNFVRVDGDLTNTFVQHPGATGNLWGVIYEKAYAFIRTGASTYASLNYGYPGVSFTELGFSNSMLSPTSSDTTLLNTITNALNNGRAVAACTLASVSGAPVIGSHCYSVIGAYRDASGTLQLQLRNPWGIDGAGSDANTSDGLVTITYSQFAANFSSLNYATA